MVEHILEGLAFAGLVACALEFVGWLRRRRRQRAQEEATGAAASHYDVVWRTLTRLAVAVFAGFVLGGVTAGVLERALGLPDIELFTWRANALIAKWTGLAWWYISTRRLI